MPCWRRRRRRTRRGRRRFEEFEGGEREGSQMKIVGGGGPVDAEHLSFEFYARWMADAYTRENNTWSKWNYEQKIVDKAQMLQGLLRESCVYLQMRSSPTTARTWPFPQSVEGTPIPAIVPKHPSPGRLAIPYQTSIQRVNQQPQASPPLSLSNKTPLRG